MFIPFEFFIIALVALVLGTQILFPALRGKPMFPILRKKSYEDMQLDSAKEKHERAQKLLKAAEQEAKAVEMELKADEVRDKALWDKIK